eukprot:4219273-Pleurochrysis_carterae.AAC.1
MPPTQGACASKYSSNPWNLIARSDRALQEIEQLRSDVRDCHARVQCCAAEHAAAVAASQVEEPDIAANSARTAQVRTQAQAHAHEQLILTRATSRPL